MGHIVSPDDLGLRTLVEFTYPYTVDIIAVHGLGGHPISTWTHHEKRPPGVHNTLKGPDLKLPPNLSSADNSQDPIEELEPTTFWLKDLLPYSPTSSFCPEVDPEHLPLLKGGIKGARIRTFGYDSTRAAGEGKSIGEDLIKPVALELLAAVRGVAWEGATSQWQVRANSDRPPLVFVAMDIGGTIVKEALTIAATSRYYKDVLFHTQLLLFFGVPSHITPDTTYRDLLLDISLSGSSQPSNRPYRHDLLSTALKPDVDATFSRIESNFSLINPGIRRTVSLFATVPTPAVCNTVVIPQPNAVLGGQGGAGGDGWGGCELEIGCTGKEHIDVARFSRQSTEDLEIVGTVIELVNETVVSWKEHPGLSGDEEAHSRDLLDYLDLQMAFSPLDWEWYGPVPAASLMENHWEHGIHDLSACSWLEEDEGYKLWYTQGTGSGANTPGEKLRKIKTSNENDIYTEMMEVDEYTFEPESKGGGVLHVYGKSGTGKTMLTQYLLQRLLENARAARTAPAALPPSGTPTTGGTVESETSKNSKRPGVNQKPSDAKNNPTTRNLNTLNAAKRISGVGRITRPIILAYIASPTHNNFIEPFPTAMSTHHGAHILATLIAQYLIQDSTSADTLHHLHRSIWSRRIDPLILGWTDDDMWLLFDEMLAARGEREVIIIIDDDYHRRQQHPTGRAANWLHQRLIDRVASGGPEGNGLVKLFITTRSHGDVVAYPDCKVDGYSYQAISLDIDSSTDVTTTAQCIPRARKEAIDVILSELLASSTENEKSGLSLIEGVLQEMLLQKWVTWLDLQLALTLPSTYIPEFATWFEQYQTSHDTVDDDDTCDWELRNRLYQCHYRAYMNELLVNPNSQQIRWATLALGWLLYTPMPLHAGTLAMAISISQSWGKQAVPTGEPAKETRRNVDGPHEDFAAILSFLSESLAKKLFLSVIPATGQLHYDQKYASEGTEFIGLRQSDVRKFLLETGRHGDGNLDRDLPNFDDAAKWNELMALTCFDVMELPGAQDVKLLGEYCENFYYIQYDTYASNEFTIPGVDGMGEKTDNDQAGLANEEEANKEEIPEDNPEKDMHGGDGEKQDSTVEGGMTGQTAEEKTDEVVLDSESGDVDEKETEIAVLSSVDHVDHEAKEANKQEGTKQDTNETENQPENGTFATGEERESEPQYVEEPTPPAHLPTHSLIAYATLNWPIHAREYYSSAYPSLEEDTPVDIASSTVTRRIIAFATGDTIIGLDKWRTRYILLSRTTTTTYPPPPEFSGSPLQLFVYFGLLPLVKHSLTSQLLQPHERDLEQKIRAMRLAARGGQLDCFKYLFNLLAHLDYGVVHFIPSLERAGQCGAIDIMKELMTGKHSKKIKMLLQDAPSGKSLDYSSVLSAVANNGQIEALELLLDHIPEGTYSLCGFAPLKEGKVETVGDGSEKIGCAKDVTDTVDDSADSSPKESQDSPLHSACKAGFTAIVKYLLDRTAPDFPRMDPCKADSQGFTPLHHAAGGGFLGTTKLLLKHPAIDVDTAGWTIKPLHLAAEKGFHVIVQNLLQTNANVDVVDDAGRNPLHRACVKCFIHVVRQLLMQGVDANQEDSEGFTPLHIAANCGNFEVLDLLINHGAEPNAKVTATGNTPLHYAATKGFEKIAQRLLDCGATVNGKLIDSEITPLHLAAYYEHVEICRMLLESGADPHLIAKRHENFYQQTGEWTVLQLCMGNSELTRMFIDKGVDINYQDDQNNSALIISASSQSWDAVKLLIQAGADVKNGGKKSTKSTPLYFAISSINPADRVRYLLEQGADVNAVISDYDIRTPIHVAASAWGGTEVLDVLLEFGADPNGCIGGNTDTIPASPLYNAASCGNAVMVEYLLDRGAKPDFHVSDHEGRSPLVIAAEYGYESILRMLIEKGASVDLPSNGGFTALYKACTNGGEVCARILLEDGKASPEIPSEESGWTPLHGAAAAGYSGCVALLLDHGGDINRLTKDTGSTALWLSANSTYHDSVCMLLLQRGADPTILCNNGKSTALHAIASRGNIDLMKAVLEYPGVLADINGMYDDLGDSTALHVACTSGYTDVVQLLLDHGADPTRRPDPPTTEIRSCLNAAGNRGYLEIVQSLLKHPAQVKDINAISGPGKNTALLSSSDYPEIVKILLENGADPTIPGEDGATMLHFISDSDILNDLIKNYKVPLNGVRSGNTPAYEAVMEGRIDNLKILINAGAILIGGVPDGTHGWSPLQYAAHFGEMETFRLLIAQPSVVEDIDYQNVLGGSTTALQQAAMGGHAEIATILLDLGAGVDIPTSVEYDGHKPRTPLASSAREGHVECMKVFLDRGADVNGLRLCDDYSEPPLARAAENGSLEACQLLLNHGADIHGCGVTSDDTPLAWAASEGFLSVCKLLLEHGANVNGTLNTFNAKTPLHRAAGGGHAEICKLLLEHGAIETDWNETPLSAAAVGGHLACVEVLLEHGYHVDNHKNGTRRKNKDGSFQDTPLIEAAFHGHSDVLKLLLKHGADPNVLNSQNLTPLHIACEYDYTECVKLLLEQSTVDPNHGNIQLNKCPKGGYGRTPLFMAVKGRSHECVELLLKAGVNPSSGFLDRFGWNALAHAAALSDPKCLRLLIEAGGDVNQVTQSGHNLLSLAARNFNPDAQERVEYLLEKGANVDGSDPRGIPLLDAALGGSSDIWTTLLQKVANVKPADPDLGRTPIFYAAQAETSTVDVLKSLGDDLLKDINVRDYRDRTPLFYAVGRGRIDVIKFLLEKGADKTVTDCLGRKLLDVVEPSEKAREIRELLVDSSDEVKIVQDADGDEFDIYCNHTPDEIMYGLRECDRCRKHLVGPQYFLHCCDCKEGHDICVDCFVNKGERCPTITAKGEGALMFGDNYLHSHIAFSSEWMNAGRLGPLGKVDQVALKAREILREMLQEEKKKKKVEEEKTAEENKEVEEKKEKARKHQEELKEEHRKKKAKAKAHTEGEALEKEKEKEKGDKEEKEKEQQKGHETEMEKEEEKGGTDENTKSVRIEHKKPESAGGDRDDATDDKESLGSESQVANVEEIEYGIVESEGDIDVEIEEIVMDDDDE